MCHSCHQDYGLSRMASLLSAMISGLVIMSREEQMLTIQLDTSIQQRTRLGNHLIKYYLFVIQQDDLAIM